MDQQTQILIGIIALVVVIGVAALIIYGRKSTKSVGRRKFGGQQVAAQQQPAAGCSCGRNVQPCPPSSGPGCVPAYVHEPNPMPAAIYDVALDDCCNDGRLTRSEVQEIVKMVNAQNAADRSAALAERLEGIARARLQTPQAPSPPAPSDVPRA